jgi:SAM-dependent methyltransferase
MIGLSDTPTQRIRRRVASLPVIGAGLRFLYRWIGRPDAFRSSPAYWETRYRKGGSSGSGSYGRLARFKADVINHFVEEHEITSVIEFGCGDGAQLELAKYPRYTGFDVSRQAVDLCRRRFIDDGNKQFFDLQNENGGAIRADMALSLDVIYHLVEDAVYDAYMRRLMRAAERFICVYSSNTALPGHVAHIRHRCFTDWFGKNAPEWIVIKIIRNAFPYDPKNPDETSWADFYFLSRASLI